jgi:hypothetical protein
VNSECRGKKLLYAELLLLLSYSASRCNGDDRHCGADGFGGKMFRPDLDNGGIMLLKILGGIAILLFFI